MVINDREFPVVVQAYQPSANGELFVAEQMVRNQVEVDAFSSRYAGYVIKARVVKENEMVPEYSNDNGNKTYCIYIAGAYRHGQYFYL